jgi:hypothetical protein
MKHAHSLRVMAYFSQLTTALQNECKILRDRVQRTLKLDGTERVHGVINTMRSALEKLKPESWFLAGYELGVSDALEALEITDEEILRSLSNAMKKLN